MGGPEGAGEGQTERRRKSRRRVLFGGIVAYADGRVSFDCIIRSLSMSGARIAISETAQLPAKFYLICIRDRVAYEAQLAWRDGSEAGVEFAGVVGLPDISNPAIGFLKRVWLSAAGSNR